MNDIVQRLRKRALSLQMYIPHGTSDSITLQEAADEIERLSKEVDQLRRDRDIGKAAARRTLRRWSSAEAALAEMTEDRNRLLDELKAKAEISEAREQIKAICQVLEIDEAADPVAAVVEMTRRHRAEVKSLVARLTAAAWDRDKEAANNEYLRSRVAELDREVDQMGEYPNGAMRWAIVQAHGALDAAGIPDEKSGLLARIKALIAERDAKEVRDA